MRLLTIALTAALAAMMVGCSSTPTVSERRNVPPDRILAEELLKPSAARTCRVTVTRDYDFAGSAGSFITSIDGKPFARLGTYETVTIYAMPGKHLVGAVPSWNPFGVSPVEQETFLTASQPTSMHVTVKNGVITLQPSSERLF
jgi:hypothetical protein